MMQLQSELKIIQTLLTLSLRVQVSLFFHISFCQLYLLDGDKTSQYEIKLMDIDSEHLGIPVNN